MSAVQVLTSWLKLRVELGIASVLVVTPMVVEVVLRWPARKEPRTKVRGMQRLFELLLVIYLRQRKPARCITKSLSHLDLNAERWTHSWSGMKLKDATKAIEMRARSDRGAMGPAAANIAAHKP